MWPSTDSERWLRTASRMARRGSMGFSRLISSRPLIRSGMGVLALARHSSVQRLLVPAIRPIDVCSSPAFVCPSPGRLRPPLAVRSSSVPPSFRLWRTLRGIRPSPSPSACLRTPPFLVPWSFPFPFPIPIPIPIPIPLTLPFPASSPPSSPAPAPVPLPGPFVPLVLSASARRSARLFLVPSASAHRSARPSLPAPAFA